MCYGKKLDDWFYCFGMYCKNPNYWNTFEPQHDKTNKMTLAPSELRSV